MNDKNFELEKIYTTAVENQQKGNYAIAENLYKKILKKFPEHINTQCNLGSIYVQTGQLEKGMRFFQNVLKANQII